MNRHNAENYKMLTRVADFATNNMELFAKSSASVNVQTSLKAVMGELAVLSSARIAAESAVRSARNERDLAHDILKGLLAQADLTARALNSHNFRAPIRPTDHALIDAGRAFPTQIEPLKAEFVGYGFSPDAVTAAVESLERTVLAYATARARRSAAIRGFDEKLEAAMTCMRQFEALVANTLGDNTAAMAEWTMARTVTRVTSRKKAVEPTEPTKAA